MIEPARLIDLARATVGRMSVPEYLREDAVSHSLETALRALRTWRSDKGCSPETFVILKMRFAIRSFLATEYQRPPTIYMETDDLFPAPPSGAEARLQLYDLVKALQQLDPKTRAIVIAFAEGRRMADISREHHMFGRDVLAIRQAGLAQLKEAVTI